MKPSTFEITPETSQDELQELFKTKRRKGYRKILVSPPERPEKVYDIGDIVYCFGLTATVTFLKS